MQAAVKDEMALINIYDPPMSHFWCVRVVLIFSVNGMWVSRHAVPPCSSWVFIRALRMTTEYMTWLGTGILGKSWNFGRLDGTQSVRSWPVPH